MEFYIYIYIYISGNDNNYYNYRKSSRAAIVGDDDVNRKDSMSSGFTPLIVTALYRRNANASCVTWLPCAIYIPPLLTIGQTHRVSSSSFFFFFFKNIYTLRLLRLSTKNGKTLSRPINGINFFSSLRGYTALLPSLSNISFIA